MNQKTVKKLRKGLIKAGSFNKGTWKALKRTYKTLPHNERHSFKNDFLAHAEILGKQ